MTIKPKKKRTKYPRWFALLRNGRDFVLAQFLLGVLAFLKLFPADWAINTTGKLARFFGMIYPRTKIARTNIALAFPEKSKDEIENILKGMWENLGRTAAEYVYLDQIFDYDHQNPEKGRFEIVGSENFVELANHDGPAICFTGHLANWEVLPIGAAAYDLNVTALFRPPNNRFLAKKLLKARRTNMGHLVPSKAGAAWALSGVMAEGGKVGVLADQYFHRGFEIEFFGRKTKANPLLAKLARNYDCPVYPARTIRLPGGRFRLELLPAFKLPRDKKGQIDEQKLTEMVNQTIEGWIGEYPEQWLWLHKRWRY